MVAAKLAKHSHAGEHSCHYQQHHTTAHLVTSVASPRTTTMPFITGEGLTGHCHKAQHEQSASG
jgi:hypothetical protein